MLVEILPNAKGPLIVDACIRVGYVAFTIGTLGFLGLGIRPPTPDWGGMVNAARNWIIIAPWVAAFPALAISSLVVGLNLFADGLREISLRKIDPPPLLRLEDLSITYATRAGDVPAVRGVSLTIERGEAYGLVGESGCGKTSVAMAIMAYLGRNRPSRRRADPLRRGGPRRKSDEELRALRGRRIAMVYQDPLASLNPCLTVGEQLSEVLTVHQGLGSRASRAACHTMLERVACPIRPPTMRRYPHQLSGGQQQRVVIAMALLANPDLLIMDEPTTGLDVTVEATVLDLVASSGASSTPPSSTSATTSA